MDKFVIIFLIIIFLAIVLTIIFRIVYDFKKRSIKKEYLNKIEIEKYENMLEQFKKLRDISDTDTIEEILVKLNLTVEESKLDHNTEGDLKENVITVTPSLSLRGRNFCIAHEIAHIVRGDKSGARTVHGSVFRNPNEDICDYIAAAILLPYKIIKKAVIDSNYKKMTFKQRILFIQNMADTYNVDQELILRRIDEITILESKD